MKKLLPFILIAVLVSGGAFWFYQKSLIVSEPNQEVKQVKPIGIANPASANCLNVGGKLKIEKRGDGSEYGLCYFDDNKACEEWSLLRGNCPDGGVKTTGFDTIAQKYCAWTGGSTLAVPDSVCTFKDSSKCPTEDYYNGKCLSAADNIDSNKLKN